MVIIQLCSNKTGRFLSSESLMIPLSPKMRRLKASRDSFLIHTQEKAQKRKDLINFKKRRSNPNNNYRSIMKIFPLNPQ